MPTAAAPENAMANSKKFLVASGLHTTNQPNQQRAHPLKFKSTTHKFLFRFSVPQSSATIENAARTGMLSKLL